jgi:trypsin
MRFKITLLILKLVTTAKSTKTQLTGHIVGGEFSRIENFPYSAHLTINCGGSSSACGASILNQVLLLTAAHCVFKCKDEFKIKAYTGSVYRHKGFVNYVAHLIIHEEYNAHTKANDIAVLKLEKPLTFGPKVKRIALVKEPPDYESAVIAGWGWIDVSLS